MRTCVPVQSDPCLSAVKRYVRLLADAGLPVSICSDAEDATNLDGLSYVVWGRGSSDADQADDDRSWDLDEDITEEHVPISTAAAAQYHRNLVHLGTNQNAATAWLKARSRKPKPKRTTEATS